MRFVIKHYDKGTKEEHFSINVTDAPAGEWEELNKEGTATTVSHNDALQVPCYDIAKAWICYLKRTGFTAVTC